MENHDKPNLSIKGQLGVPVYTPNSVPMVLIGLIWGFQISHRGTLVGVHPTNPTYQKSKFVRSYGQHQTAMQR